MKNLLKTTSYSAIALVSTAYSQVNAAIDYGNTKVTENVKWNSGTIDQTINNILSYLFGFLYLVAFILIIWAGFNILTANGDDEKVKSWKKIVIQALIGLVLIFLADQITQLIFSTATSGTAGTGQ